MKRETLDSIVAAAKDKRGVVLVTDLDDGAQHFATDALADEALASDRSIIHEVDGRRRFYQPFNPPLRMIVVGAVHVAQSLVVLASELGYRISLVDPRAAFLREERFAGIERTDEWPDEALARLAPDHRTAIVVLSHDPKIDDPALEVALRSDAFYIGALGSRRTHAQRIDRLRSRGFDHRVLDRIHAPIGLDIGARTPPEIAASIVAEVTLALRGPKRGAARGAPKKDRRAPSRIGAVVLAAGQSRRMGEANKLMAEIDGEPMVRRVVRMLQDAEVSPIVVVLGHEAGRVRDAIADLGVRTVVNVRFAEGMSTSVRAGVDAIEDDVDAALFVLADMPWVTAKHVRAMCDRFDPVAGRAICVPVHEGRRGNPVLWASRFFADMQKLTGDAGARSLLGEYAALVSEVDVDDPGIHFDVDTPESFARLRR